MIVRLFNKLFFLVLLAAVFCVSAFAAVTHELFFIGKNTNRNIVRYDVRMTSDGQIDLRDPIDAFWLLNETNGSRSELSTIDRRAYGFSVRNNDGVLTLVLRQVQETPITIKMKDSVPVAVIDVDGREIKLQNVMVQLRGGFMGVPRVEFYTLNGIDLSDGKEFSHRVDVR